MRKTNPSVNSIILRKHKVIATDNLNKQPNIFLNVIEVNSLIRYLRLGIPVK